MKYTELVQHINNKIFIGAYKLSLQTKNKPEKLHLGF